MFTFAVSVVFSDCLSMFVSPFAEISSDCFSIVIPPDCGNIAQRFFANFILFRTSIFAPCTIFVSAILNTLGLSILFHHICDIVQMSTKKKMIGIDTSSIVAPMQYIDIGGNISEILLPNQTMKLIAFAIFPTLWISITRWFREKYLKTSGFRDAILNWFGFHGHLLADAILGLTWGSRAKELGFRPYEPIPLVV